MRFALIRVAKIGLAALAIACLPVSAFAQGAAKKAAAPAAAIPSADTGVPNALQGFSQNKDKPIQIEAQQLDVRDKDKVAIFSGNVVVVQGDTTMKCKTLHVFYDQDESKGAPSKGTMKAAQPGPGGKQGIKRLEARGGVIVIQKEQTATGETGIFEMKTNTVTLVGGAQGVVVTQGTNVLRGERLVVDLSSGYARVESGKGRTVQGIFSTNKEEKDEKPGGSPSAQSKEGQKPAAKKSAPSAAASTAAPFPAPIGQPAATAGN
jgi:lipopolysaccharide export system protein LptA